jgi:hypothetical protein
MSRHSRSFVVGSVAAVAALVLIALHPGVGVAGGTNADTVDGFHAVACSSSTTQRAGKLVATCKSTGRLPDNIIATAPNSARLGGKVPADYLLKSAMSTRSFSCSGSVMTPGGSGVMYETGGGLLTSRNGFFRCNVVIPDGATITGASATVRDNDSVGTIACAVSRQHVDVPTTASDSVADVGMASPQDGDVVLSTTAITNGVVNNARFAYRLSCALSGGADADDSLGIFGGRVTYRVSALRG